MIVDIAIALTILGSVLCTVLIARGGTVNKKKKNALRNLADLYQLCHGQRSKEDATIQEPNQHDPCRQ